MTHDEPLTIARRLADRLEIPLRRWPSDDDGGPEVLLIADERLDEVPAERFAAATAVLVAGDRAAATSAGLVALRERVRERADAVPLSTFATVHGPAGVDEVPLVAAAPSGDERVARLLSAGQHSLLLDPAVDALAVSDADEPARVCVVSFEVAGMTGGGIGTASTALAETLARKGHDVTLLFTGWQEADAADAHERWKGHYAERGVRLEIIRTPGTNTVKNPHFPARCAYEVYCWLRREQPFDVVHLPENLGHGAYAQLAKRQGAAFADTTFVVGTHGPTRWAAEANRVALTREEFLVNDAFERLSVRLADVLLGPSRYLHDYKRVRGWQLPERVAVQAYSVPSAVRDSRAGGAGASAPASSGLPREIVFFGRLETRKGVATLCDALDLLAADAPPPEIEVTFLGPPAIVLGEPADRYIERRAGAWPWSWRIVSDRDQQGAAEYLRRPGVLAVMPSTVDNAPNTVTEVIALGVPLVAGGTGGTGELVAAEQRDDNMFGEPSGGQVPPARLDRIVPSPDPRPLAELLRRRLTTPVEPARTPTTSEAVDDAYDRWHRAVRRSRGAGAGTAAPDGELPTLACCVLFDGDEPLVAAQLDALGADGDELELVVVDLRAADDAPIAAAQERGVRVVRPARPGHGGFARETAIDATRGQLVAFVPPVDVPLAAFAQRLREAARTGADVYGCAVLDRRDEAAEAAPEDPAAHAFVPLFGPPLAGLTHPAFCVGPYAIRRDALERVGGFSPDARGDEADHELLNRAAALGLSFEVVPEPLAEKRRDDRWTRFRSAWPYQVVEPPYDAEQWLRVERAFAEGGGTAADLVGLLRGARDEAIRQGADKAALEAAYEQRVREQRQWIDDAEARAAESRQVLAEQDAELARLTALARELETSVGRLAQRTLRNAVRRVRQRVRR